MIFADDPDMLKSIQHEEQMELLEEMLERIS